MFGPLHLPLVESRQIFLPRRQVKVDFFHRGLSFPPFCRWGHLDQGSKPELVYQNTGDLPP